MNSVPNNPDDLDFDDFLIDESARGEQAPSAAEVSADNAPTLGENTAESPAEETADEAQPSPKASAAARKLEPAVLAHVLRENYRPVKPKVIAKQMKLASDQERALKLAIRRLVKAGKLAFGSGHLVRPPLGVKPAAPVVESDYSDDGGDEQPRRKEQAAASAGLVTGTFRRAAKGFGFVRPRGTIRSMDRGQDIFIALRDSLDASNGDVVAVRLSRRRAQGRDGQIRRSGEIVKILRRDTHQFVGVYREKAGEAVVEIDGKVFARPVPVGDPGAKGAQAGDKVVIEMVQFPSHVGDGEAVITEVLGPRGAPGVDTLTILREYELPEEFPEEVLEASRQEADKFDEAIGDRLDLTGETIITIDPVDARDFDDAVSLTRLENGHWRLGVHIADVSHFVRPRSPLDREARDRGTSVYLPDRVIPMLPEVISNHLASLQPNKVRYTQTAFIEYTPDGVPVHSEFRRSAIKSCRRFTYEEVDEYLANRDAWKEKLSPAVFDLLARMHELAMVLRARRLEHGAIELTLPEVKIDLDKRGEVCGAHRVINTESHQIIEEFMLAANQAVARMLDERQIPFLRRIHEMPDPRKLDTLTRFIKTLGIECDDLHSRFEVKRVIAAVAGKPAEYAVNYAVLRSMQKAIYSPATEGHYALKFEHYCHFTSPIRRYPDLTVHRLIELILSGRKPQVDLDKVTLLAEHCSDREQRAAEAERELKKIKLLGYMQKRIGSQLDAVVTGVEDFGLFVQGVDLPAEGLLPIEGLGDDYYQFDSESYSLAGHREGNQFRLGDRLRVEVVRVDIDRRELDFRLVKRFGEAQDGPRRPRRKESGGPDGERGSYPARGPARDKHGGPPKKGKRKGRR